MAWATLVCVPCRFTSHVSDCYRAGHNTTRCPTCRAELVTRWYWSPPKRRNRRAWRLVEAGVWNWDRRRWYRIRRRRFHSGGYGSNSPDRL